MAVIYVLLCAAFCVHSLAEIVWYRSGRCASILGVATPASRREITASKRETGGEGRGEEDKVSHRRKCVFVFPIVIDLSVFLPWIRLIIQIRLPDDSQRFVAASNISNPHIRRFSEILKASWALPSLNYRSVWWRKTNDQRNRLFPPGRLNSSTVFSFLFKMTIDMNENPRGSQRISKRLKEPRRMAWSIIISKRNKNSWKNSILQSMAVNYIFHAGGRRGGGGGGEGEGGVGTWSSLSTHLPPHWNIAGCNFVQKLS